MRAAVLIFIFVLTMVADARAISAAQSIECSTLGNRSPRKASSEAEKWGAVLDKREIQDCFGAQFRQIVGLKHEINNQKKMFKDTQAQAYRLSFWLGLVIVFLGVLSSCAVALMQGGGGDNVKDGQTSSPAAGFLGRMGHWGATHPWTKAVALVATLGLSLLTGLENLYKPKETVAWTVVTIGKLDKLQTDIDRELVRLVSVDAYPGNPWSVPGDKIRRWQEELDSILEAANASWIERSLAH